MKHILYLIINTLLLSSLHATNTAWDWHTINVDDIYFPPQFLWGTATSAHQVEGNCTNNWSIWENPQTIHDGSLSGNACDHWNLYQDDIRCMKKLGVNAYRFSIEWSKIEPEEGVFDSDALAHYQKVCAALIHANITPMITLHHFTHPVWFEKKGGFEKQENNAYFVRFCTVVFNALQDKVPFWCTINEPNTYAFQSYFTGMFAPGVKNIQRAVIVLKNMLDAHVQVYHTLKKIDSHAQVGIAYNITQFKPYRRWDPLLRIVCALAEHCFNTLALQFLTNGEMVYTIPCVFNVSHTNKNAPTSLDFFGLNYYSYIKLDWQLDAKNPLVPRYTNNEIMTDLPYPIFPEGFYDAIQKVSCLNVPIYITENGIADAVDDRRELFIKRYLYVLSHAIKNGYDIRGYFYWSLMDNFEWCEGFQPRFGLYQVDYRSQKRMLRPSAQTLIHIIERFKY